MSLRRSFADVFSGRFSREVVQRVGCSLLLFVAGCGSGANLPEGETGTVSGRLTSNGQAPSTGATVVFIHQDKGLAASGVTDATGNYALKMRGGTAILVGTYAVGVSPLSREMTKEEEEATLAGKLIQEVKLPEYPEKYRIPESSGLVFEVKPGVNTFDIDIKPGE